MRMDPLAYGLRTLSWSCRLSRSTTTGTEAASRLSPLPLSLSK
uniref:Uncharacterized protein n=1 Tax=Anguilla anguilla TaxID=7936 RepID=A0A0E9S613_ANGAN